MNPKTRENYRKFIKNVVYNLPEDQAIVLSLFYVESLTFDEIGHALDISAKEALKLYMQGASKCLNLSHKNKPPSL